MNSKKAFLTRKRSLEENLDYLSTIKNEESDHFDMRLNKIENAEE